MAAVLLAGWPLSSSAQMNSEDTPQSAAIVVLDQFMVAFNARDMAAWEATFNFPHIRFASGRVVVLDTPGQQRTDLFDLLAATGWDHSAWHDRTIIAAGPDKVHVDVTFKRYRQDGTELATYRSLYIVTKENGKWGVQARSSFAP